jgi:uncharacterized RDD family membrane protein YckC
MDRDALGSWLSGPGLPTADEKLGYPGERLGLPPQGIGSSASWGSRIGALFIDWFVALGVALGLVGSPEPGDQRFSLFVLLIFVVEYVVLLATAGRTMGMAVFGLRVLPVGSSRLNLLRVLIRSLLLALVIPAVIYDRDRRGLHDKAARTVVVRTRA